MSQIRCELCVLARRAGAWMDASEWQRHLSTEHPEWDESVQTWPDGSPVIEDTTLTPEDFK